MADTNNKKIKVSAHERMVLEMLNASISASLHSNPSMLLSGVHRTLSTLLYGKADRAVQSLTETCEELSEKE